MAAAAKARRALVLLGLLLGASSCLEIDGGAVELSWVTYCASGKRPGGAGASATCTERAQSLARVQLLLRAVGAADGGTASDGCAQGATCLFPAEDGAGTTGFKVPPGDYEMALLPLDADGSPLGGPSCVPDGTGSCWQTPSPVARTVVRGEVVSLGAVLIVVPE